MLVVQTAKLEHHILKLLCTVSCSAANVPGVMAAEHTYSVTSNVHEHMDHVSSAG